MIDNQGFERQKLRSRFLAKRNAISPADRTEMSRQIIEALIALPVFREKKRFFIYCSYQSEVETILLLNRCLAEKKTVCVPVTVLERSRLLAITITDPSTDLSPGPKGIPEPISSLAERRRVNPQSIEVVIIPGVVFDRSGYRIGYGGGYYDRFLAQAAPQALRIGLAYSRQLVHHIPVLSHDIPMDMLLTDKEVLAWPRSFDAKNSRI